MTTPSRLSIVTICLNGRNAFEATAASVESQTVRPYEYIVIDGGSTDGTLDAIRRHAGVITKWVSEKDDGISDAFNKGIARATGDWILFLNAGDTLAGPRVIESVLPVLAASGGLHIVNGRTNQVDSTGRIVRTLGWPVNPRKLRWHCTIPHQGVFHNATYFCTYGLFDPALKIAMDFDMLSRAKPLLARYTDIVVAATLLGGVSQSDYKRLHREDAAVRNKNIAPETLYSRAYYFLLGVKMAIVQRMRKA